MLKLDQAARTATLVAQYPGGGKFETEYMGDTQPLQNGNTFVGWGSEPYLSEYSPSGKLLLEGSFPGSDLSYRSTLEQWVGKPLTAPAGAARQADGKTTVYASWNGATEVVSWRVLADAGTGSGSGRAGRRGAGRQVRLRDGDRSAERLQELRGAGAGRRRPGDRSSAGSSRWVGD